MRALLGGAVLVVLAALGGLALSAGGAAAGVVFLLCLIGWGMS